jgi:hypothetical protein
VPAPEALGSGCQLGQEPYLWQEVLAISESPSLPMFSLPLHLSPTNGCGNFTRHSKDKQLRQGTAWFVAHRRGNGVDFRGKGVCSEARERG